jgi:hypothetical protein
MFFVTMSRITMNKFQLLVATSLIMSAAMASSASADCQQGTPGCPPLKLDGGGGGTDGGPMGSIFNRNMGTIMPNSGYGSSSSSNGYSNANQGSNASQSGGGSSSGSGANTQNSPVPGRSLQIGTGKLPSSDDPPFMLPSPYDVQDPAYEAGRNGDPRNILNMVYMDRTEYLFKVQRGSDVEWYTETHWGNGTRTTTITSTIRNATSRTTSSNPMPAAQGPGSLTIVKKDGIATTTTLNPQATAASISAGAAKRAAIKNDPAALAAAQAAAKAKASAPSAPRVVASTSSKPKAETTASKPKVAIAPPPVAKPKPPTATQAVISSVVARAPASSMR